MEKKKILIIEDDQRLAENLVKGLSEKDFDTAVAYDGQIGLRLALSGKFDLILLDVNLPQMNGYEVCAKIREKDRQTPVIMLTALGETDDKITGFEHGADDYIVKPFEYRELVARINVFLKRAYAENETNANILRIADLEINFESKMASRQGKHIDLTPKEFSLLEYLIRNKGKVVSKAEIAGKIWEGNNAENSLNVIEVYINFLRKKIDKDFEPKLIHTKTGMGYVLKDE
jgi:two-component system copper resistance phosphate regulon response regulator CusR